MDRIAPHLITARQMIRLTKLTLITVVTVCAAWSTMDTRNTISAPVVAVQGDSPVAANAVRIRIVNGAPMAPQVDVSTTTPGDDFAASAPLGSFPFGEDLGPRTVPPSDYQIRATLPDDPGAVVFDSVAAIQSGALDLVFTAVESTSTCI